MLRRLRIGGALLALAATLTGCGGGGGGSSNLAATGSGTPAPSPSGTQCSLSARQSWAAAQLREWYLFPETLPASLDSGDFSTVQSYIDALTATARAQGRDRFFTHLTSLREENAFFNSGSSAGFGFRLQTDAAARRAFVTESFETAPAFGAGLDRGDEILAIGEGPGNLRLVSDIIASEGTGGVSAALGPSSAGVTRTLRLSGPAGTREITITKADYALQPVSNRYGVRIIEAEGKRVGYLNLRTFISTADPQLREAFARFRDEGVTELIIDFRYNGGGLVSTAQLIGDLLGRARFSSDVLDRVTYRPEKSSRNETRFFRSSANAVAPMKIAFIGTGATASASELVINSQLPYLGQNVALVGANSFGKPVGQIALDREACDDRLRVVAFSTQNAAGQADYFQGLAAVVPNSCTASDDVAFPLGDPQEAMVKVALDFLASRPCTPIPAGRTGQTLRPQAELLTPAVPSVAQREVPGLF